MKKLIVLCLLGLAACGGGRALPPPEPIVRTVEVKIPTPVRCKALDELGDEPEYADANDALVDAPDLYARVKIMLVGRAQRIARLAQYAAAKGSC